MLTEYTTKTVHVGDSLSLSGASRSITILPKGLNPTQMNFEYRGTSANSSYTVDFQQTLTIDDDELAAMITLESLHGDGYLIYVCLSDHLAQKRVFEAMRADETTQSSRAANAAMDEIRKDFKILIERVRSERTLEYSEWERSIKASRSAILENAYSPAGLLLVGVACYLGWGAWYVYVFGILVSAGTLAFIWDLFLLLKESGNPPKPIWLTPPLLKADLMLFDAKVRQLEADYHLPKPFVDYAVSLSAIAVADSARSRGNTMVEAEVANAFGLT